MGTTADKIAGKIGSLALGLQILAKAQAYHRRKQDLLGSYPQFSNVVTSASEQPPSIALAPF
jgi:hypothetical protein